MTPPQPLTPWQAFGRPYNPAAEINYRTGTMLQERFHGVTVDWTRPPLPPLPPAVPSPPYLNSPPDSEDDANASFYAACALGNLDEVRAHLKEGTPLSEASLAYALEEACQNLQLEVVRLLLTEKEAKLHFRCFRRCIAYKEYDLAIKLRGEYPSIAEYQSIFTSGSLKLLPLLKILKEFGSWHPNQVLGPLQRRKHAPGRGEGGPRQEVALHYPRCVLDSEILNFLLESGADATISRYFSTPGVFERDDKLPTDYVVQRHRGHILEMAVNCGAEKEAITAILERGHARLMYGIPLHSLARRRSDEKEVVRTDETYMKKAWQEDMEMEWPVLSTRLETAAHLIKLGEDIEEEVNVFWITPVSGARPTNRVDSTPLLHAKHQMDWSFVHLLLEMGADPIKTWTEVFPPQVLYDLGDQMYLVEARFQQLVEIVKLQKMARGEDEEAGRIKRDLKSEEAEEHSAKKVKREEEDVNVKREEEVVHVKWRKRM